MCTKEEVREVLKEEFNGEFVKDLPVLLSHINDTLQRLEDGIKKVDEKISFTNGKVADLISWREQLEGASFALKGVWGIVVVFVTAAIFGVFWMWVEFQSLDTRIQNIVADELLNYEFQIVE